MKILSLHIKNFRSLRDVQLTEVGDFNILVGKNSCGKSNLLEGLSLFFNEFLFVGGTTAGLNEFFWHNKRTKDPIQFTILIELTNSECEDIFPKEMLEPMKNKYPRTYNQLRIRRKIVNLQGAWETESLEWSKIPLVKSNKQLIPTDVAKHLMSAHRTRKTGTRQLPPPKTSLTPEMLSNVSAGITNKIRKKFSLVSQIRDVGSPITYRTTLIDSKLQNSLWTLDQSTKDPDEQMYADIEGAFRGITGKRLDAAHGEVFIKRGTRRFPLSLEGGGVQAAISLVFLLKQERGKGYVFGIEEPEAHSHSELQQKLFSELKALSSVAQIFIATHSPTFVDRADLTYTWIVKFSNGETHVEKINELKQIIEELGIRPSDILFFANRILFVEGKTEEIVLPVLAKKLGIDLGDVAIIPTEGKDGARLNLKTWVRTTRHMCPLFLLLDKDAKKEAEELVRDKLIEPGRYHVWQLASIESYYPLEILSRALKELNHRYSLGISDNGSGLMEKIRQGTLSPDKIDIGPKRELLDKSWKVLLAESVARLMKAEKKVDIDEEVNTALRRAVAET